LYIGEHSVRIKKQKLFRQESGAVTLTLENHVDRGWKHEEPQSTNWDRWVENHAAVLLLFARQQTRTEADAQDIVQDALVECCRRVSADTPPPIGLVFATIRRRAVDLARSESRRSNREAASQADEQTLWFESDVEDRERNRIIQNALRQLPAIHRETLILKVWGGLTFAQIAEALEIPQNTAASRYRYALEELRKSIKDILA
jgi:RNA polymerase sigma-70 factor (ECF subfamily)